TIWRKSASSLSSVTPASPGFPSPPPAPKPAAQHKNQNKCSDCAPRFMLNWQHGRTHFLPCFCFFENCQRATENLLCRRHEPPRRRRILQIKQQSRKRIFYLLCLSATLR